MFYRFFTFNACLFVFLLLIGSVFTLPIKAGAARLYLDPILTRPATTVESLAIIVNARYFKNVKLEEADRFTGYAYDLEVMVPLTQSMQLRFILPAYTYGKARLIDPSTYEEITIKGPAGTFDYPTILFEHQFLQQSDFGYNFGCFVGYGRTIKSWGKLNTTHGDIYNHQGDQFRIGLKADGFVPRMSARWFGNLGLRNYHRSDDLNPAETGDNFTLVELMGAVIFDVALCCHPGIEMVYSGDVDRYHAVHLIPQIIMPVSEKISLKAGAPVSLTGDGERYGARLQLHFRR